jgi:hypothetical protein
MFSLDVVETDSFLELSVDARLLYYELGLRADDEGFVASPKMIIRTVGCKPDNLDELIKTGYVIKFFSGVIVITHWKMNNRIQSDRFHNTIYQNELSQLIEQNNVYYLSDTLDAECIRDVSNSETEVSVGKDSLVENSQTKENSEKTNSEKINSEKTRKRELQEGETQNNNDYSQELRELKQIRKNRGII